MVSEGMGAIRTKFPEFLWLEILTAAIYLPNRLLEESLGWKMPYEVLFNAKP